MNNNLSESQTKINLLRAFAGESQARNRYTFAASQAKKENLLHSGDKVVISAGVPLDIAGNTNMIRVENV